MVDFLRYRLSSIFAASATAAPGGQHPAGIWLSPRLELEKDGFFAELRMEAAYSNNPTSPFGISSLNASPSGTMDGHHPLVRQYTPENAQDTLAWSGGLRNLAAGYRFTPEFSVMVGRYRFDQTELENRFNDWGAYSEAINFARVGVRLDWAGIEARFNRVSSTGDLRRILASFNLTENVDGSFGSMGQLFTSFALGEGARAPLLSLTAYYAFRTHPQDARSENPGFTLGGGAAAIIDWSWFAGGFAFAHSERSYTSIQHHDASQGRNMFSVFADAHPGDWRLRASLAFLTREDLKGTNAFDSATFASEWHGELSVNYSIWEGFTPGLIYHVVHNPTDHYDAHFLAIGLQTNRRGTLIP